MFDFMFDASEESPKEILLNNALTEYERATGFQWRIWDNNEYEFCVHLMNEFGIAAKPVTDATWEAECCHWGVGVGGNLMDAVFNCYLDYVKDVGDGDDK